MFHRKALHQQFDPRKGKRMSVDLALVEGPFRGPLARVYGPHDVFAFTSCRKAGGTVARSNPTLPVDVESIVEFYRNFHNENDERVSTFGWVLEYSSSLHLQGLRRHGRSGAGNPSRHQPS